MTIPSIFTDPADVSDIDSNAQDQFSGAYQRALGHALRTTREGRGWTLADVVKRLPAEFGRDELEHCEQGDQALTTPSLFAICRALGVSPGKLIENVLPQALRSLVNDPSRVNATRLFPSPLSPASRL